MDQCSSQAFFTKLIQKDKQKVCQLYESKDKENVNKQHIPISKSKKNKKVKTDCSFLFGEKKVDKHWYLDRRDISEEQLDDVKFMNNWVCLEKGIVEFKKIIEKTAYQQEIKKILEENGVVDSEGDKKSVAIKIWTTFSQSLVSLLLQYALPLLSFGKGTWSLAALTSNRRFDLLSLDAEGSILWKSKNPLSKVQLQREQLMRRVFGFSVEKEKELDQHEILAKLQLQNNNVVYFILRDCSMADLPSNAELLVEQEIIIDNIQNPYPLSILRPNSDVFNNQDLFREVLEKLGFKIKCEEQLEKHEREQYLKSIIEQLQGELHGKQQQLKQYKNQEAIEAELPIPSERISMGQERYMHLTRTIKESKML